MFHPMMLAHPINEEKDFINLKPSDFVAELKWDGIRVQLVLDNKNKKVHNVISQRIFYENFYDDYNKILDDRDIDIVLILTSMNEHAKITKKAIIESINNPKEVNMDLVHAQESRRILDRLFGFLVSKILWTNVKGKLSAGRVQSPAIKIIIDKEKERLQFIENTYYSITTTLN